MEKTKNSTEKFCSECGSIIPEKAEICVHCGVRQKGAAEAKNAGLAAVLSALVPGLGQICNGQIGKGILFFCIAIANGLLAFVVIGFITGPIFWIYNIYDAYSTADKINKGEVSL